MIGLAQQLPRCSSGCKPRAARAVARTASPLQAVRLVAEGEGEEARGGALFAQLQHAGSGTPVASFQGVKIGIQSKNTILLHSAPLPAGAQHTLPEFVAMCHEFPASDFDALHGGLDKLLASCCGRTAVTGGKELPEGTLLRHISMGDFLVVWDPHWGGGPAKKYYLPQPLPQRRGRGRPPGPPGLPTKTGKAEWDVSQLQAHRVQLVLDLTERRKDGKPNFKLVRGAQPVTPLPQPPPGLQWSGLLDGASSGGGGIGSGAAEGGQSGGGGVHAWCPLSFRKTTES